MAKQEKTDTADEEKGLDPGRIKKRLDLLDQRLDNIDSVVTAAVERLMNQAAAINAVCPHCGKGIEISITGSVKPRGKA